MKESEIMVSLPVAVVRLLPHWDVKLNQDLLARRKLGITGNIASYIPKHGRSGLWFVRHTDGETAPYSAFELTRVLSWLEVRQGRAVTVVRLQDDVSRASGWHPDACNRRMDARGTILQWVTDKFVLVRHEGGEQAVYEYQELAPIDTTSADTPATTGKRRTTKKSQK